MFDFEGVWNELLAKKMFSLQSWPKCNETLKEYRKNGKVLKKAIARFLPFFKIVNQKLIFFMETGN